MILVKRYSTLAPWYRKLSHDVVRLMADVENLTSTAIRQTDGVETPTRIKTDNQEIFTTINQPPVLSKIQSMEVGVIGEM